MSDNLAGVLMIFAFLGLMFLSEDKSQEIRKLKDQIVILEKQVIELKTQLKYDPNIKAENSENNIDNTP